MSLGHCAGPGAWGRVAPGMVSGVTMDGRFVRRARPGVTGGTAMAMALGLVLALGVGPAAAGGSPCTTAGPCPTAPVPAPLALPKGYVSVWTDGRLNPHRGRGTEAGAAAMALIWTDSVPMDLVADR